jgi:tRNA1Val (adenine37-N6)-methyltransferase
MSNTFFRFKQFTVYHDLCAMKVGTDGVLLGAWANCANSQNILDAGCGSGLIALMLAQRSDAKIDAIDINAQAYEQTRINISHSPFAERINAYCIDFFHYFPSRKYDLIVSNPPYFTNSLKSQNADRCIARHNNEFNFNELFKKSIGLLTDKGLLSFIFPSDAFKQIQAIAHHNHLYLIRQTIVHPLENRPPKRILLEFSRIKEPLQENEIFIENTNHSYSQEYINLTKNFYLYL